MIYCVTTCVVYNGVENLIMNLDFLFKCCVVGVYWSKAKNFDQFQAKMLWLQIPYKIIFVLQFFVFFLKPFITTQMLKRRSIFQVQILILTGDPTKIMAPISMIYFSNWHCSDHNIIESRFLTKNEMWSLLGLKGGRLDTFCWHNLF